MAEHTFQSKRKLSKAAVEIPLDSIIEILTRLPVRPLFRFKCVSKSWNSLISSHFKSNPKLNIIVKSGESLFSALIYDNISNYNTDLNFTKLNHPLKPDRNLIYTYPYVIDSCGGVLLFSTCSDWTMYLYNPANNDSRLLPPIPSRICPFKFNRKIFGFGYDSHNDDYKVIAVFKHPGRALEICVYSLRENVWKHIKDESFSLLKYSVSCNAVGANGVLYFKTSVSKDFKPGPLMCFDVRTEAVSILDYPELDCYAFPKVWISLSELRGCLCMVVNYRLYSDELGIHQLRYADVWEKREGGWIKLFKIKKNKVFGKGSQYMHLRLVAYSKDKGKVLLELNSSWLGWYDLVTKRFEKVKTLGYLSQKMYTNFGVYVSVNNDKPMSLSLPK